MNNETTKPVEEYPMGFRPPKVAESKNVSEDVNDAIDDVNENVKNKNIEGTVFSLPLAPSKGGGSLSSSKRRSKSRRTFKKKSGGSSRSKFSLRKKSPQRKKKTN